MDLIIIFGPKAHLSKNLGMKFIKLRVFLVPWPSGLGLHQEQKRTC